MPGRPKSRAKRFAIWEDRLWALLEDLRELASRQSTGRQGYKIDFWAHLFRHLEWTIICASAILFDLEDRAELDAETLQLEREERRGLRVKEEERTENAEGALTQGAAEL